MTRPRYPSTGRRSAPRRAITRRLLLASAIGTLLSAVLAPASSAAQRSADSRPNVLLILTDDVGYGDIGSYGAPDIRTPNIDRLAREGVRLTDFYAAPQCTPTRAALITGRYQQRVALERALSTAGPTSEEGLLPNGNSLPQLLKNAGVATGLVGKWHLGFRPEFSPNAHGFDYFYGFLSGYIDYYTHTRGIDGREDLFENGTTVHDSGYMTDLITEHAVRFMRNNAARPFFLEVAYNAAHWPFQRPGHPSRAPHNAAFPSPGDSAAPTRADYVAMLEHADGGVGTLLAELERLGVARNTLVIFTNDNGGEWLSRNAPLFHRKDTLWEGGIRVPAIFRWSGHFPAGQVRGIPGITMDLSATILAATHTPIPPQYDGRDLAPMLQGRVATDQRALFWRINTPLRQQRAVRLGKWKLLVDGDDILLFDLTRDVGERNDVAYAHPDIVRRLRPLLAAWEKDVDGEAASRAHPR